MTWREGVLVVALVFVSGQLDGPVGKLETEGIPAFAPPTLRYPTSLQYQYRAKLIEIITHRQTGVTAADDDRLNLLYVSVINQRLSFHESCGVVNPLN